MRKRLWALSLALTILLTAAPAAMAAGGSLGNFRESGTYRQGQFADVAAGDWFAQNVETAFELGLMKGSSATLFNPNGNITAAETVAMAARLHSIYETGTESFVQKSPWYQDYVDYAEANGIIAQGQFASYTGAATRLQFAAVFSAALPDEALAEINTVEDGAIPDTDSAAVYKLYRAGILTGSDTLGTFKPGSTITRAEASAIVARMADESLRKNITLKASGVKEELTAEEIYAQCSPAVFYIVVFDAQGDAYASGSGFFISADGTAVTNYHVIEGSSSAYILTSDTDKVYKVAGVLNYSAEEDWAVIKIDGTGFKYLQTGDSSAVQGGATVYAIGSPRGLQNTISQGIISNPSRDLGGVRYIQTTAAISPGSSGGALLDKYGNVVGITSGGFDNGQNLNVAVPINSVNCSGTLAVALDTVRSRLLMASATDVSLSWGDAVTVNLTQNTSGRDVRVTCYTKDTDVVSWSFGDWDEKGRTIPLTISAIGPGSATVVVALYYNDSDASVAMVKINVNVSLGVNFYSGYYPAPDFGDYAETPLFCDYSSEIKGTHVYYYKISDLPADEALLTEGYLDLLKACGFKYFTDTQNESGYTVQMYTNDYYGVIAYFGKDYVNKTNCLSVTLKTA